MSDDEALERAFHAMRDATDGAHPGAAVTRLKVLDRARSERRARRRVAFVALPIAAAFVGSLAWGAMTGRLSAWLSSSSGLGAPPHPSALVGSALPGDRDPRASSAPGVADVDAGASAESERSTVPVAAPSASAAPSTSVRAAPSGPSHAPEVASASVAEQSAYAVAHRAHFEAHDSAAALRGWDAYLVAYPSGHFALEARYNRAICLVRLGRRDEARAALGPFARGEVGGYRQREAAELLDALAGRDGG